MARRFRFALLLATASILLSLIVFMLWIGGSGTGWFGYLGKRSAETGPAINVPGSGTGPADSTQQPDGVSQSKETDYESRNFPPPPVLPHVPPESSEAERREAFGLTKSVDRIVQKNEPFDVGGKQVTIEQIQRQIQGDGKLLSGKSGVEQEVVPTIKESDIGSVVRKPVTEAKALSIQSPVYYGVRVVRPSDNIWNIHYAIIQEYFAKRNVVLLPKADEPLPGGMSSGIGRLLKFIEGVVYVFNVSLDRMEADLNLVQPHSIVVFFRISDLFSAFDHLQPDDIRSIRLVSKQLQLESPHGSRQLLDRKDFIE